LPEEEELLLPATTPPPPQQPHRHRHVRVVIWFHHIKNLGKRKALVAWARELRLRGRSKPGFPGLVVVEGAEGDVRDYVARVKALQWQAMQVRGEEEVAVTAGVGVGPAAAGDRSSSRDPHHHNNSSSADVAWAGMFAELPETGTAELGRLCATAGCEALFLAALKLQ
jgi:hypothetical protein